MTVQTQQSSITFTGIIDGVDLNVPFPVEATSELTVLYGADLVATLGVHYSVTLSPPNYDTAIVTPLPGFAVISGGGVAVARVIPYLQTFDLPTLARLGSSRLEQICDRLTFLTQQLRDRLARSLLFRASDPASSTGPLPAAADRALKFLAFDGTGLPIASIGATSAGSPLTAFGASMMAAASAVASLILLGFSAAARVMVAAADAIAIRASVGAASITGTADGAKLKPYSAATISSTNYSHFPGMKMSPTGRLGVLFYAGKNHGQSDVAGVALLQAVAGAGNLVINGNYAAAGTVTLQVGTKVGINSDANDATRIFTITGSLGGVAQIDTVTAVNVNTVYSTRRFDVITQVSSDGVCAGNIKAGLLMNPSDVKFSYSDDGGYTWSVPVSIFDGLTSGAFYYYYPSLGVSASGEFVAICLKFVVSSNGSTFTTVRRATTDGGRTFGAEAPVTITGAAAGTLAPAAQEMQTTPSGKMLVGGYVGTRNYILVSADDGLTFTAVLSRNSGAPATSEMGLAVLDERTWLVVYRVDGVTSTWLQSVTTDAGTTWSAEAALHDLNGTLTVYGGFASPQLTEFSMGGQQYVLLSMMARAASSGTYDKPSSLIQYYGRAEELILSSSAWQLRQVLFDGALPDLSGYPSVVVNPVTKMGLVAYGQETTTLKNASVKVAAFRMAPYLPQNLGSARVADLTFDGTNHLKKMVFDVSFLPVITGSTTAGANAYTLQGGRVTRIGSRVSYDFDARINGAIASTGNLRLILPYRVSRNLPRSFIESAAHGAGKYPQYLTPVAAQSYATIEYENSTSFGSIGDTDVSNNYRIAGTLSYTTDED